MLIRRRPAVSGGTRTALPAAAVLRGVLGERDSAGGELCVRKMWTMFRIETVLCTFSVLYVAAKADFKAGNCSEVREACVAKGFSFAHVPLTEISGTVYSTEKVAIHTTMLYNNDVGNVSRFWIQKVEVVETPFVSKGRKQERIGEGTLGFTRCAP